MATTSQDSAQPKTQNAKRKRQSKPVEPEQLFFQSIAEQLASEYEYVSWGRMMSSPGIRYKDKFFVFYYNHGLVYRFGREFSPESIGITEYTLLAPFKSESRRAPLRDWFCIDTSYQARWEELAKIALQIMAGDELEPIHPETTQPLSQKEHKTDEC